MKLPFAAFALVLVAGCSSAQTAVDAATVDHPVAVDTSVVVDTPAVVDASADDAGVADVGVVAPVDAGAPVDTSPLIAARPYRLIVPDDNDPARAAPLLILLHGYGASGLLQELYFRMTHETNIRGILYATPDGTMDATGHRFWNATDACCDFAGPPVDDVAYVDAIIDDVSARYAVDPRRIFLLGHSNGGFMSHRMACDRADRIAAIVSLAGATWNDPARCNPSGPVAVLEVHGTADTTIPYNGGANVGIAFPSATTSVSRWAGYNHCATTTTAGADLDLDTVLPGSETHVARYDGCTGGAAELWSITGGEHIPTLTAQWPTLTLDWLMAHPKPAP